MLQAEHLWPSHAGQSWGENVYRHSDLCTDVWDVVQMNFAVLCTSGAADDRQDRSRRRKVVLSGIPARCESKVHSCHLADCF